MYFNSAHSPPLLEISVHIKITITIILPSRLHRFVAGDEHLEDVEQEDNNEETSKYEQVKSLIEFLANR
jgi:hypothetical protein